jgi:hypothetical protein
MLQQQLVRNSWVPAVPLRFLRVPFVIGPFEAEVGKGTVGNTVVVCSIPLYSAITTRQ